MSTLKYPILQSGYLGLSTEGLTQQPAETASFAETILFIKGQHEFDNLYYSEDVTKLYEEWIANSHIMSKPAYQHRILEQAMRRFGPNIFDWIFFQGNKPGFSQTHKQFLIKMSLWLTETCDQPEHASGISRWVGFLGPGQGNSIILTPSDIQTAQITTSNATAIGNWMIKPAGYESLLSYLYVIFGKRVGGTFKPTL